MSASDRLLATRLRDGDPAALGEFFEHHVPRLYRFALRQVRNRPDLAEEVVQATLVQAIEKLDTYRGDAALVTWLCSICRNLVQDDRERAWRHHETETIGGDDDFRVTAEVKAAMEAAAPEATVLRAEDTNRVHATLDDLSPPYGDVLEWKYIEGLSVKEIAARLGVTPKAAESTLTRARSAFRRAFEGDARDTE